MLQIVVEDRLWSSWSGRVTHHRSMIEFKSRRCSWHWWIFVFNFKNDVLNNICYYWKATMSWWIRKFTIATDLKLQISTLWMFFRYIISCEFLFDISTIKVQRFLHAFHSQMNSATTSETAAEPPRSSTQYSFTPSPENSKTSTKPEASDDEDKKDDSMYVCNICLDIAKDSVVSYCGHLYCWPCLSELRWSCP